MGGVSRAMCCVDSLRHQCVQTECLSVPAAVQLARQSHPFTVATQDTLLKGRLSLDIPARAIQYRSAWFHGPGGAQAVGVPFVFSLFIGALCPCVHVETKRPNSNLSCRKKLRIPNGLTLALDAGLQYVGTHDDGSWSTWLHPHDTERSAWDPLKGMVRPFFGAALQVGGSGGDAALLDGEGGILFKREVALPTRRLGMPWPHVAARVSSEGMGGVWREGVGGGWGGVVVVGVFVYVGGRDCLCCPPITSSCRAAPRSPSSSIRCRIPQTYVSVGLPRFSTLGGVPLMSRASHGAGALRVKLHQYDIVVRL